MEYIDILDPGGNKTGEKKLKKEVHARGLWHRTAHIWLMNPKGELLIQKRSPEKESHPNLWDISAAGHVDAGEDAVTAAIRETREELGLDLAENDFKYLFTNVKRGEVLNGGAFLNNEFQDVYLAQTEAGLEDLTMQPEEVLELKWIPVEELQEIVRRGDEEFVPHPEEYKKLFEYLNK